MSGSSPGSSWPGRLVSAGVVVLVVALAAATFIVSYSGVRDLAITVGVSSRLARLYPAILDGVLVVACAAVFMLRDSSLWRRIYAWFSLTLLIAIIGAADALHAMSVALPKRPAEGTAAVLPWVLILLGFSLLLTMLRRPRAGAPAVGSDPAPAEPMAAEPVAAPLAALPPASEAPPSPSEPGPTAEPAVAGEPAAESAPQEPQEPQEGTDAPEEGTPLLYRVRSVPIPPED
jgi:hypothetical protein